MIDVSHVATSKGPNTAINSAAVSPLSPDWIQFEYIFGNPSMYSWLGRPRELILSGISRRPRPSRPHPQRSYVGPSRGVCLLPGGCGAGEHHPPCRVHGADPARCCELCAHEHGQEPPPALRGVQARWPPGAPTGKGEGRGKDEEGVGG